MPAKPITFELTDDQLEQIQSYTDKSGVTLRGRVSGKDLVIERIEVAGKFLALNRVTKKPRG